MLLVTANTMAQSVRERTNEIAVLKTLGYTKQTIAGLVLTEAFVITALGGVIGLGVAALFTDSIGELLAQFFPVLGIPTSAYVTGGVLIVALSLRSEEHTSELQSLRHLVCRLLLEKKKISSKYMVQ